MVRINKKTVLAIVLILIAAIIMPIVVITLPKEDSTVVQAATLTDSQLEQRRANPGLYVTDSMDLYQSGGVEYTWDVILSKYFVSTDDGKLKVSSSIPIMYELVVGNVTGITDMNGFLKDCAITSVDLTNLDTSNVTDMSYMFADCTYLKTIILGNNFNTQNVTTMERMFYGCRSLTSIDLSKFDTSKTTTMERMFYDCRSLKNLDVSNFNTQKITTMAYMFYDCKSLTSLDISNFSTENVTSMSSMFFGCKALTKVDFSSFNTKNVTSMSFLFERCYKLTDIVWGSNFTTENVTSMSYMFDSVIATSLDLSKFNTSKCTGFNNMFANCTNLKSINFGNNFDTSSCTTMENMFRKCTSLEELDLSSFDTSNVEMTYQMFSGCTNLKKLNISSFNLSKSQNCDGMFSNCPIEEIKTPANFNGATFNSVALTSWNPSKNYYIDKDTGTEYKDKDAQVPTGVTLVLYTARAKDIADRVNYPGIYEPGTITLIKSWDEIVDDVVIDLDGGIIALDTGNLITYEACDIVCGVATVNTVYLYDCIYGADLTNLIFENFNMLGVDSINLSFIEFPGSAKNVAVAASLQFYNLSNLGKLDLSIFDLSNATGFNGSPILYFGGCTNLKEVKLPAGVSSTTFNDIGLTETFKSYTNNAILSGTDSLINNDVIYTTENNYQPTLAGGSKPDTPSTGVVTDMLGFVVTAVIVVALCYVATRKKKVQR